MTKRILYIIIGAVLILALIIGLWFWFFNRQANNPSTGNLFGSGQNASTTGTGAGGNGNGQAPTGSNTSGGVGGGGSGSVNTQTPITQGNGALFNDDLFLPINSGVEDSSGGGYWNTGSGGNSWVVFNPTSITALNNENVSGQPYITKTVGADGKGAGLGSSLAVLIAGCVASYTATTLIVEPPIIALDSALGAVSGFLSSIPIIGGLFGSAAGGEVVTDPRTHAKVASETVSQCLVRTLGRLAVQKITDATVNWINSGFNGKPAFVQDYKKFFTDVADEAAGAYIQGSNFAFLCSPFKLQVRVAIAQSYARRSNAPSCTLSQVAQNVDNFFANNSGSGWNNLITFTTEPANNPFAAFMTLQAGLYDATGQAVSEENVKLGNNQGFLSVKKCTKTVDEYLYNLPTSSDCVDVSPGRAVVSQFDASTQATLDSLQIGESIDQILAALQSALINKIMSGLATRASAASTNPNLDTKAQTQAVALMDQLQTGVTNAQQYASIQQRIITDLQGAQQNLAVLANCWISATSSPNLTSAQLIQANTGASNTLAKITQLQTQVDSHNTTIQLANNSIVALQSLQTDLLMASVASDVNQVQNSFTALKASNNPHIYTAADITTVQQDRDSVQTDMSILGTQTSSGLQQCYALGV